MNGSRVKILKQSLILALCLLPAPLRAQDYSGTYYIANANGYNAGTPASNYYLVPADDPQLAGYTDAYYNGNAATPFMTTYKCGQVDNAVWIVQSTGDGYYYIIHSYTGKYVVYQTVSGLDAHRKCMHLESTDSPGENAKFQIIANGSYFNIRPKGMSSGNCNWTPSSGNKDYYYGQTSPYYYGGLIGLYSNPNDAGQKWKFEEASAVVMPTITPNAGTKKVVLSTGQAGATIYYTLDGTTPTNASPSIQYTGTAIDIGDARKTVKAVAYKDISGTPTASNVNTMLVDFRDVHEITALSSIGSGNPDGIYKLTADISSAGAGLNITFTGTIDGDGHTVSGLTSPLFASLDGATVHNLTLDKVNINTTGKVGAIAGTATGNSHIYNVGILGGTVKSSNNYCGGIVGELGGHAHIVNCYNYASVEGTYAGGIVGYNTYASTSGDLRTMVMNCMVYGDITGTVKAAPVYGGEIISNRRVDNTGNTGLNNYNYFAFDAVTLTAPGVGDTVFNCALGAEDRYLLRFEFYRSILNSNRALAAFYATGSTANGEQMLKWVRLPDSIGTNHPYPILDDGDIHPSIINPDAENATTGKPRNQGGKLGTLSVTIQMGSGGAYYAPPEGASISTGSLTLNITDKDTAHYNFNYRKVQLPYYNQVGTRNYYGNRVVTGWKIVGFTNGTQGTFTTTNYDSPNYNYSDRSTYAKDLYGTGGSNRVFAQGAYYNVPDGVTGITIEPYWAYCSYLSDGCYDVTYDFDANHSYKDATNYTGAGVRYTNNTNYTINGSSQKVYTSFNNARNNCDLNAGHSVYDNAIVLVGNYHSYSFPFEKNETRPYSVMSADLDLDNEPDNNLYLQFKQRETVNPIRFDFISIPGIGMAHKVTGSIPMPQVGIFKPKGWFEITGTCLIQFGQFEYDYSGKSLAPLILQGGIFDQFVSTADNTAGTQPNHTQYMIIGDNAWFKMFNNGVHGDRDYHTPKRPISVTGGEYDQFYLSGMFNASAAIAAVSGNTDDLNAECYIDGGRFGELAGSGMEQIDGNITWSIHNADITNFYGGGINSAKEVTGSITTTIDSSFVEVFCGGPKFGDMHADKTVITTATGCTFGTYFGAGYGGTSYNRVRNQNLFNQTNYPFNSWRTSYYQRQYDAGNSGIATNFEYELLPLSGAPDKNNVGRFYVNYASLSKATTHDVTSTLTGCTILGNYYGGGNLGLVSGNTTSTLTNCIVHGSAFGAGFSAAAPGVEVMPASNFVVEPYYNGDIGVYIQGEFPESVKYTWHHADAVSAGSEFDETNHYILTTETLDDLGSVTGNATIIILGRCRIYGNVYGGGNQGEVGGNTKVVINGATTTP